MAIEAVLVIGLMLSRTLANHISRTVEPMEQNRASN